MNTRMVALCLVCLAVIIAGCPSFGGEQTPTPASPTDTPPTPAPRPPATATPTDVPETVTESPQATPTGTPTETPTPTATPTTTPTATETPTPIPWHERLIAPRGTGSSGPDAPAQTNASVSGHATAG